MTLSPYPTSHLPVTSVPFYSPLLHWLELQNHLGFGILRVLPFIPITWYNHHITHRDAHLGIRHLSHEPGKVFSSLWITRAGNRSHRQIPPVSPHSYLPKPAALSSSEPPSLLSRNKHTLCGFWQECVSNTELLPLALTNSASSHRWDAPVHPGML